MYMTHAHIYMNVNTIHAYACRKENFSSPIPLFHLYYLSDSPVLIYLFFCEFQKTNPQHFHLSLSNVRSSCH